MIYVASSWRNSRQPGIVQALRAAGHEVYDFRAHGDFHWRDIDPAWESWEATDVAEALRHPLAQRSFACDMEALEACDALVLVMPCGRSAHLELGYAIGAGKRTAVLLDDGEPELMWAAAAWIGADLGDLIAWLKRQPLRCRKSRQSALVGAYRTIAQDAQKELEELRAKAAPCSNCGETGGHDETCPAPREELLEEAAAIYRATRPTTGELLQLPPPGSAVTIRYDLDPALNRRVTATFWSDDVSGPAGAFADDRDPETALRSVLIQLPLPKAVPRPPCNVPGCSRAVEIDGRACCLENDDPCPDSSRDGRPDDEEL